MVTLIELAIVFLAIFMGVRHGGLALGFWGGLGLIVLAVVFGVFPTAPPIDVMLIILAVCTAASCMEAVGGLDILVRFAAKIIRAQPKMVGVVAPVVSFFLTFFAVQVTLFMLFFLSFMKFPITRVFVLNPQWPERQSPVRLVLQPARLPLLWLR